MNFIILTTFLVSSLLLIEGEEPWKRSRGDAKLPKLGNKILENHHPYHPKRTMSRYNIHCGGKMTSEAWKFIRTLDEFPGLGSHFSPTMYIIPRHCSFRVIRMMVLEDLVSQLRQLGITSRSLPGFFSLYEEEGRHQQSC